MRKIILDLAISLDGFIAGPNQEIDWIIFDDENGKELAVFADEVDKSENLPFWIGRAILSC